MPSLLTTAASLLLLPPALVNGMYAKSGPVLQVDGPSYDSLIAQSNHTSIVEFYAPWCGHCKNLKPAYEKAATALQGLAKVAAVDCDAEENKPFCGRMGVQGFPTLKIVKPGKKPGRPIVEDYQGPRTAKGIVEAVKEKIPNRVSRLKDDDYEAWLSKDEAPKAILFSDKGVTGPLLKALAIDFQGSINVAQIRNKEKKAVEQFKAKKFPALVLIPGDGKDPILYDGEMKKESMVKFLSQAASPNPDPAPKEKKAKKDKKSKTNKSAAPKASKAAKPAAHPGAEDGDPAECPYKGDKEESSDSKEPAKPATPEPAPLIASLADEVSLQQNCLNTKAGICILALHPAEASANSLTTDVVIALSEIQHKHSQKRKLFPFFQLPASNPSNAALRETLALTSPKDEISLIATNGKKAWFRAYPAKAWSHDAIEAWIDGLRMGDSTTPKQDLAEDLLADPATLPAEEKKSDQGEKQKVNLNLNMEDDDLSRAEAEELIRQLLPEGETIDLDSLDPETYKKIMAAGKSFKAEMKEQGSVPSSHSPKEDVEDEGHDEL